MGRECPVAGGGAGVEAVKQLRCAGAVSRRVDEANYKKKFAVDTEFGARTKPEYAGAVD